MTSRSILLSACLLATFLHAGPASAKTIAHWNFDEASGDKAIDSVGGIDGILKGDAAFVPGSGIRGGAVELDASGDGLVSMGDTLGFTGNDTFSLQVWVETSQTTGALVVGRHVSTVVAGYWIGLNNTNDGSPVEEAGSCHFYQSDNPQLNSGDVNLDDGNWHQIVAVRDATQLKLRLYVDGTRVPTPDATGDFHGLNATTAPFLVGGLVVGSTPTGSFTGRVDDLKVWDHALGDAEVKAAFEHPDYQTGLPCGDINFSDSITASDALGLLKAAVGTSKCSNCMCDVNLSTKITSADALLVLRKAVGQPVELTCESCYP